MTQPPDPPLAASATGPDSAPPPVPLGKIWVWLALAGVVAIMIALSQRPRDERPSPALGKRLLELKLDPLTGDSTAVTLADLAGQVVLINYWGTWCPPCRAELPDIVSLAERYRGEKDFRLLAVSCDGAGDNDIPSLRQETASFLTGAGYDLATYADPGQWSRRNLAMVTGDAHFGYPTTLLLDRQGVIRGLWVGYDSSNGIKMRELIDELLTEEK